METIPVGEHFLHIEQASDGHHLRLVGPHGGQSVEIIVTAQGPVLRLGSNLRIELAGALQVDAEKIALHGRHGITVTSGEEVNIEASTHLTARADLGDVRVKANDDLRLDGERILMNCSN
jgi:hypothetical protein